MSELVHSIGLVSMMYTVMLLLKHEVSFILPVVAIVFHFYKLLILSPIHAVRDQVFVIVKHSLVACS